MVKVAIICRCSNCGDERREEYEISTSTVNTARLIKQQSADCVSQIDVVKFGCAGQKADCVCPHECSSNEIGFYHPVRLEFTEANVEANISDITEYLKNDPDYYRFKSKGG